MTKIKICGLTRMADIYAVNEAKPDYIGFVFAKSKRQVSFQQAAALKAECAPSIKAVGVFVNQELEFIKRLCRQNIIDLIQLHGDEDEQYMTALKKAVANPVIKAIRVKEHPAIMTTAADYILFDTYSKEHYGGTGQCFDWRLIKGCTKPFYLAGGLDAGNIKAAMQTVQPYCLDVSSGVETNGIKDKSKIITIVDIVKGRI